MCLHIFDLDGTLIPKNTSFHFYFYLLKKRKLPLRSIFTVFPLYFRYQSGLSLAELHTEIFNRVLKGKPMTLFTESVEPFLDSFLPKNVCLELLSRTKGKMRWLFSGSPEFLVAPIAKRFGFEFWKGTEYQIDAKGNIAKIHLLVDGAQKLVLARQSPFQREEIIAYSDSREDLPLLEWAGKAEIVNPNQLFAHFAKKKGWEILKFPKRG